MGRHRNQTQMHHTQPPTDECWAQKRQKQLKYKMYIWKKFLNRIHRSYICSIYMSSVRGRQKESLRNYCIFISSERRHKKNEAITFIHISPWLAISQTNLQTLENARARAHTLNITRSSLFMRKIHNYGWTHTIQCWWWTVAQQQHQPKSNSTHLLHHPSANINGTLFQHFTPPVLSFTLDNAQHTKCHSCKSTTTPTKMTSLFSLCFTFGRIEYHFILSNCRLAQMRDAI